MNILVINSGSSSIKVSIFDAGPAYTGADPRCLLDGAVTGIGTPSARLELPGDVRSLEIADETAAIASIFDALNRSGIPAVDAIGYRVVHPGPRLDRHQRITPAVLDDLEHAVEFAPLHDPATLRVVRAGLARFPSLPHFACFDTVFHQTMPAEATTYAIPQPIRDTGVRRYGFHGLSCESVLHQLRAAGHPIPRRMAIAHLGSGCSVTALLDGRSVDTTMGLTPTGGIVMGTRPGDLDPGLVVFLTRHAKGVDEVESMLNHTSGMVALSGLPNDMKLVRQAAASGNAAAQLAIDIFTRAITKVLGSFCWLLGGLDSIVFTGGIGEHDKATRAQVLQNNEAQGILVDPELNDEQTGGLRAIHASHSHTEILVVPAQEDLIIAIHVDRMARQPAIPPEAI